MYFSYSISEPGKEKGNLVTEISKKIDEQVEHCISNSLETEVFGKKIKFTSNIKMTQIDHKVRQMQIGGLGMYCTCCDCTKGQVL